MLSLLPSSSNFMHDFSKKIGLQSQTYPPCGSPVKVEFAALKKLRKGNVEADHSTMKLPHLIFIEQIEESMFMAFDGTGYSRSTYGITECGSKKTPWIPEEDEFLKEYASNRGEGNWGSVQETTRLDESGKRCRNRWTNYLRPDLQKGAFSAEEEEIIIELQGNLATDGLTSPLSKSRCRIECWVKPKMGPPSWSIHDLLNHKLRPCIPNANPPYLSRKQLYNPVILEDRKPKNKWRIPAFQQHQPSAGLQNPGTGKPEAEMVEDFFHVIEVVKHQEVRPEGWW